MIEIWKVKIKKYLFDNDESLHGYKLDEIVEACLVNENFCLPRRSFGIGFADEQCVEKVEKLYPKESLTGGEILGKEVSIMPNKSNLTVSTKLHIANEILKMINK